MPSSYDLASFDFEIWHRICARAVGEKKVSIKFIGISSDCGWTDCDIAEPNGTSRLAKQCTLICDPGAAMWLVMFDVYAVL